MFKKKIETESWVYVSTVFDSSSEIYLHNLAIARKKCRVSAGVSTQFLNKEY